MSEIEIAGELWRLDGPGSEGIAQAAISGEPAVQVCLTEGTPGATKPGIETVGSQLVLRSDDFRAEIGGDYSRLDVRGAREVLPAAGKAAARALAVIRCLKKGIGLAIHGSAVAWGPRPRDGDGRLPGHVDERAFVFSGPAGSGKSTAARAAEELGARVIADDLVLLKRPGKGNWLAFGLPWEAGSQDTAGYPLGAVFRMSAREARDVKPGAKFRVRRLAGARAAAVLLNVPPEAFCARREAVRAAALLAEERPVFAAELPEGKEFVERLLREAAG